MPEFNIQFLDHVAIRVKDMKVSIEWYRNVLGLQEHKFEVWGEFPVFMLAGKSGVAIFPANVDDPKFPANSRNVCIDHFAFNVSTEDFAKAKDHFDAEGITYHFQDHTYFHSIYLRDPDEHVVELTTLVVEESIVYKTPMH